MLESSTEDKDGTDYADGFKITMKNIELFEECFASPTRV